MKCCCAGGKGVLNVDFGTDVTHLIFVEFCVSSFVTMTLFTQALAGGGAYACCL